MRIRRVLLGGAAAAGLAVGSMVALAPSAAADQFDCTFYLMGQGYGGKIVDIGCAFGSRGDQVICVGSLQIAGVPDDLAREACRLAAL